MASSRRRRNWVVVVVSAIAASSAVVLACTTFGGSGVDSPPTDSDGGPIAANDGSDSTDSGSDGGGGGSDVTKPPPPLGVIDPPCPAPPFPTGCSATTCSKKTLYVPTGLGTKKEYPFGITSDSEHVFWVAQTKDDEPGVAYNGGGEASVLRVDRVGASDDSRVTVIAKGQPETVAIALDGDYVYWASREPAGVAGGIAVMLKRARRDCTDDVSCAPESVIPPLPNVQRIIKLRRAAPSLLVMQASTGELIRVDLNVPSTASVGATGALPSLAVASQFVFAGHALGPAIKRLDLGPGGTLNAFITLPDGGAGDPGASHLASDCTNLFAVRHASRVWRGAVANGVLSSYGNASPLVIYDFAADARYLYFAAPDMGGVFAMGAQNGPLLTIATGNVFQMWVDAKGVYWGEHNQATPGAIHMLVKL